MNDGMFRHFRNPGDEFHSALFLDAALIKVVFQWLIIASILFICRL